MDDLSFLLDAKRGNFRVVVRTLEGRVVTIEQLDIHRVNARCPAMVSASVQEGDEVSYTFEHKTAEAVTSLFRHIYLDDYTYCEAGLERPCSLLFHLQILQLARIFDMTGLQNTVRFYILQETERFHETQFPVHEFYEGVMFLYTELRECKDIRVLIANYCVNRFAHFHFAEKEIFRQTAFESPLFHKDLQQANIKNGFQNTAAMEIVQLPVCKHRIHSMNVDFACQHHSPVTENDGTATPTPERMNARTFTPDVMTSFPTSPETVPSSSYSQSTLAARPKARLHHLDTLDTPEESRPGNPKYWRDVHHDRKKLPLRITKHPKTTQPIPGSKEMEALQAKNKTILMDRLWDVFGSEHDHSIENESTDDEWTKLKVKSVVGSSSSQTRSKKRRRWIVSDEEEEEGFSGSEHSYDSEWSVISAP